MRSNYLERRSIKERYLSKMRMHVGNTLYGLQNGVAAGGWIMMRLSVVIVFGN